MTVNEIGMLATYALFAIAAVATLMLAAWGLESLVIEKDDRTPEEFHGV